MKTRKLLLSMIAVFLCVVFAAKPVSATTINGTAGQPSDLYLGEEQKNTNSGNTTERTEEEIKKDQEEKNNLRVNGVITSEARSIINDYLLKDENGDLDYTDIYAKDDDSYVFVYQEFVAKSLIEKIANRVTEYEPGWTDYYTIEQIEEIMPSIPEPVDYEPGEVLGSNVVEPQQGTLGEKRVKKYLIPIGTPDKVINRWFFTTVFKNSYGGKWIRQTVEGDIVHYHIPGVDSGIMDFDNMKKRYEALSYYLSTLGSKQEVEVRYIVQYKVRSAVNSSLRSTEVLKWKDTDQTHFWTIRYRGDQNGTNASATNMFGGEKLYGVIPYHAGLYDLQNTQCLHRTFWDAMTYSKYEYLVIAETGQVIWKNESTGTNINTTKPMDEQQLSNPIYIGFKYEDTVHVTLTGTWNVGQGALIGGYKAPTALGNKNTSVRIE